MPEIDQNVYVNNPLSSSSHYRHSELRHPASGGAEESALFTYTFW